MMFGAVFNSSWPLGATRWQTWIWKRTWPVDNTSQLTPCSTETNFQIRRGTFETFHFTFGWHSTINKQVQLRIRDLRTSNTGNNSFGGKNLLGTSVLQPVAQIFSKYLSPRICSSRESFQKSPQIPIGSVRKYNEKLTVCQSRSLLSRWTHSLLYNSFLH